MHFFIRYGSGVNLGAKRCLSISSLKSSMGDRYANDIYLPTPTWPKEASDLFEKLDEETKSGDWEKWCRPSQEGLEIRSFLRATGEKMWSGAYFINKQKKMLKGVTVFGPWLQGGTGFVHGGAIATAHDATTGILSNEVVGPCVTANLNTNFRKGIPLGTVAFVTTSLDDVSGRKVSLTSKIMSADEKIVYSDATALYILMNLK